ncbi:MAG: hypothetical protein FD123_866 [Bacteroidetes bacterium]|nr:MAG: hypothetical protein FD123_866 [Bacteroidota bacterium]
MSYYDGKEIDCNCETANPLQRDGTSQAQRLLDALEPAYIAVDERKLEDLMLFALEYAKNLRFFDADNTTADDKDWQVFISRDITTIISQISRKNLQSERDAFNVLLNDLEDAPTSAKLGALWKPCLDLLKELDTWFGNCDERFELQKTLQLYFDSVFLPGYTRLLGYELGSAEKLDNDLPPNLTSVSLDSKWSEELPLTTDKITNIYTGDNDDDRLRSAALYVKNVFEQFYNSLLSIIAKAPSFLEQSIEAYPYHKAHTGLYIAFLQVFAYLQESMNELTERHLEYYFEDILQIEPRSAQPDQVHVIFELAKNVASYYELESGTALNAGKDSKKAPILFNTDDTIVINKAQAVLFKNVLIETETDSDEEDSYTAVYASPQADSADGEGEALNEELPQWNAFGEAQHGISPATMPQAAIGFAFASPQLVLNEGEREITLAIDFTAADTDSQTLLDDMLNEELKDYFSVSLTAAKVWMALEGPQVILTKASGTYTLTISGNLGSGSPATAPYNAEKHAELVDIPASYPVVYVQLLHKTVTDNTPAESFDSMLYPAFKNAVVSAASIETTVQGVKTIFAQGGPTTFDPSKPFEAFGTAPASGSSLIIGSEEVFYKVLDSLTLNIEWGDVPDTTGAGACDFATYYAPYLTVGAITAVPTTAGFVARVEYLDKGRWVNNSNSSTDENFIINYTDLTDGSTSSASGTNIGLFNTDDAVHGQAIELTRTANQLFHPSRSDSFDTLEPYGTSSQRGFIRIVLGAKDFLHSKYAEALMRAALKTSTESTHPIYSVPPPYTPKVKAISLNYSSKQTLDTGTDEFFVIHPFGYKKEDEVTGSGIIPRFEIENADEGTSEEQESMFFIGLENAEPGLSVSMLVQVVEDSGNPDVELPDINWSYLSDNTWLTLDQSEVLKDTTNGFITSGIIKLALPEDATSDNTILPAGYHWFSASTKENSSALCKVLSIKTQAVKATFTDNGNDLTRLSEPLAASTVKKLDTPLGEIKKVSQPYASFGGRTKEEGNEYYRRVSERLRHKQRAVTIWDYERLVLENYPSIYKTKCINHTANKLEVEGCYTELAPGHVCIIVVSNLRNQNQVNPLQPSTSIGTREEIKTYLKTKCSRFVQLEVINPDYEEIQVNFGVKFLPEFEADKGYYRTKLIDDIKKFLSPWAFDEGADIVFGGKIHRSYIIDFVEERDYVDYVDQFLLYKLNPDGSDPEPVEAVEASSAKSILVSAETHILNNVKEEDL